MKAQEKLEELAIVQAPQRKGRAKSGSRISPFDATLFFSSTTMQKRCEKFLKPLHYYQEQQECILLGTGISKMFGQVSFLTKESEVCM